MKGLTTSDHPVAVSLALLVLHVYPEQRVSSFPAARLRNLNKSTAKALNANNQSFLKNLLL
jgi:adenosylmethionine-8-amino-7-oxononanoate aminotransferase